MILKKSAVVFFKNNDYFWKIVFFTALAGVFGFLYYATAKIDYVWRWNRVPRYFAYYDTVEIISEIDGIVEKIAPDGQEALIVIKSLTEQRTYKVPLNNIRISRNDFIYTGDVLSFYNEWKVGLLLKGLYITLKVSIIAIIFGTIFGLFAGISRISSNSALRWFSTIYVEIIRGSPLLVQIFIWYFVLGTLINNFIAQYNFKPLPPLWYGMAALACFSGAYTAEIVRAGIQSVNKGQNEAARSLGMTSMQAMRYVVLPQAMRRIIPPLAGQFISLVKDSSLLGIIAIRELTKAAREIISSSLQPFELWFTCAVLYLILTFSLSMLTGYIERRLISK